MERGRVIGAAINIAQAQIAPISPLSQAKYGYQLNTGKFKVKPFVVSPSIPHERSRMAQGERLSFANVPL